MIETLYYTVQDFVEEYGEFSVINLYKIENNIPILISELSKNLDLGWTDIEELNFHVEDWGDDGTTYNFVKL